MSRSPDAPRLSPSRFTDPVRAVRRGALLVGLLLPAALVSGCGGGFSWEEADRVFEAANEVMPDVYTSLYQDMNRSAAKDTLSAEWSEYESGDGFTFYGSLTGDSTWTGTVEVSGDVSWTDTSFSWELTITYVGVTYDGITLDGTLTTSITAEEPGDGTYSFEYHAEGEVEATGEVQGIGYTDFTATASYDGTTCSLSAEGEVDGHETFYTLTVMCGGF